MKRIFKISILFLVLFASKFDCKASVVSKYIHKIRLYSGFDHDKSENPEICYAILNNYGTAQLSRTVSPRTLNYGKVLFDCNFKRNAQINTLKYNFFARNSGFTRLRQLILFPFHVFW